MSQLVPEPSWVDALVEMTARMTVVQTAEMLGLSARTVHRWMSGATAPNTAEQYGLVIIEKLTRPKLESAAFFPQEVTER